MKIRREFKCEQKEGKIPKVCAGLNKLSVNIIAKDFCSKITGKRKQPTDITCFVHLFAKTDKQHCGKYIQDVPLLPL